VVLSLGVNELLGNYPPASQAADFVALASRVRAVLPNADILLVPPPDLGVSQTYSASQYAVAQRDAALANGWAFVDTPALLGPYSASSARGLWTNTTHVNALGGQVIANHVLNALRRGL
jgi:lysophospholipase L1-like esterase